MTLQTWNLLFSASSFALLTMGAIWLKYVVDQQLKAKDATIQAKEAEISLLKSSTAPALVKAHTELTQYVNDVTQKTQRISEELKEMTKKHETALHVLDLETTSARRTSLMGRPLAESDGLLVALRILLKTMGSGFPTFANDLPSDLVSKFVNNYESSLDQISEQIADRKTKAGEILAKELGKARTA